MEAEDLLAAALVPRPERVEDGILALAPAGLRDAIADVREAVAHIGRALEPEAPPRHVRDRILRSVRDAAPRRALLVVDMIVDHLAPGSTLEVPRARAVVPALKSRIEAARGAGIPVVYVLDEHEPNDPDLDAWGTHAVRGTEGAAVWPELAPSADDIVIRKPSYSAFFESKLEAQLDELGVDALVLTGCLTEIGLMATATDAMQRGYAVEIPADAQAGSCAEVEAIALGTMRLMAPFGPARRALLERRRARPARAGSSRRT